jgi:thiol-disulfide isomerase/thioredoxin
LNKYIFNLLVFLCLVGGYWLVREIDVPESVHHNFRAKELAHPFVVNDLKRPEQQVTLDDFAGQPLIMNFWASWCRVCSGDRPYVQQLSQLVQQSSFNLLHIASYDDQRSALKAEGIPMGRGVLEVLDADGDVAIGYRVRSIPATILMNHKHQIILRHEGPLGDKGIEDFKAALERMKRS